MPITAEWDANSEDVETATASLTAGRPSPRIAAVTTRASRSRITPISRRALLTSVPRAGLAAPTDSPRRRRPGSSGRLHLPLLEDKTNRLLPRVLSGRLDLAFVRPPKGRDPNLVYRHLLYETPVVAMTSRHPLARRKAISIKDIADQPLIVPDRRSRPHSHDLTIKVFEKSGYEPRMAQVADEKQTIVNLVSTGLGVAIVPRWTSRMAVKGVTYLPLKIEESASVSRLPLAAVWMRNSRDALRDGLLETLTKNIQS